MNPSDAAHRLDHADPASRARDDAHGDLSGAALDALSILACVFEGEEDRLAWRSHAVARCLPELALHEPAQSAELAGLADALAAVRLAPQGEPVETLIVRASNRRAFEARLVRAADGRIFMEAADAAERQKAKARHLEDREQLLLTSRVVSVGEMASMIAHELNQPIGSIVNIVRGLKARLKRGALTLEAGEEALDKAAEQALYASGVIQRIRTFVDQRQAKVEALDLQQLARNTLDLLDWEIARDHVQASTDLPPDLPRVSGDAVMIQQVLVNIARNALDAMRGQPADARRLTISGRPSVAGQVELTIADSGPGLSEEAAVRMFSPFNSTKPGGMGVGLGVCRSIVELHRGRLWFTAPEGGGAVFHIALPAAAPESEPA